MKIHFSLCALLVSLFGCGFAVLGQNSDYGTYLKTHLSTHYTNYDIIYSVTQHRNTDIEQFLQAANRSGIHIEAQFDREHYSRLRLGPNGCFVIRSTNLEAIVSATPSDVNSGFGVISNTYWSAGNNIIIYDSAKLNELQSNTRTWTKLAEDSQNDVLCMGLFIEPGSVVWNSNSFTANLPSRVPVPKEKWGKREVSGNLMFSNGVPSVIESFSSIVSRTLYLTYDRNKSASPLPQWVSIDEHVGANTNVNSYSIHIIKCDRESDYNSIILSPETLFGSDSNLTVLHKGGSNNTMTVYKGKALKKPVGVRFGPANGEVKRRGYLVWYSVVAVFVIANAIFLYKAWKAKGQKE